MKMFHFLVFLFVFAARINANNYATDSVNNFNYAFIQSTIKEYEHQFKEQTSDFTTIKNQVLSYSNLGLVAIPVAEKLISQQLKTMTDADKDSVYLLFTHQFYKAVNAFNDSFESTYAGLLQKIDNGINDSETKDFKKCLDICGLSLLASEGTHYIDAKYDYIYDLFKGKVSPALNDFLKIRSKALKKGESEDAGLFISFDKLYERVVAWENFMAKYPDFFLIDQAQAFYNSYLLTVLTGMDNTSVYDTEDKLSPKIKKLYENIISRNDAKNSTKIISDYYNLLKSNNFKRPDNVDQFFEDNGLNTTIEAQPEP